jgi:hypothetical protein
MIFYTDKAEIFECQIAVDGASIDDTTATLVLEGKKWNLVFYGTIEESGKCKVVIPKLDVFKEGEIGKVTLEVVVEDSRFIPFAGDFEVRTNKKVTVESVRTSSSSVNAIVESQKPQIRVENIVIGNNNQPKVAKPIVITQSDKEIIAAHTGKVAYVNEIISGLKNNGITSKNFVNKQSLFNKIVLETVQKHKVDYKKNSDFIMKSVIDFFSKNQ